MKAIIETWKQTKDQDKVLFLVLLLTFCFNIFDAFITFFLVSNGLAVEYNPVMNLLLQTSPASFFILKFLIPIAYSLCIWQHKNHKIMLVPAISVGVLYFCLFFYQICLIILLKI